MVQLFLITIFCAFSALAAPTTSLTLSTHGTKWEETPAPPDSNSILLLFRSPVDSANKHGTLTLREDKYEEEKNLKDYSRKWLKDYPKFGYKLLGSKPYVLNGHNAFAIDALSISGEKQVRQILVEKGKDKKQVALLTCMDDQSRFRKTLEDCNTILKTLSWKD